MIFQIILSRIQAILMRHSKRPGPSILDAKMASLGGFFGAIACWGEPERYAQLMFYMDPGNSLGRDI